MKKKSQPGPAGFMIAVENKAEELKEFKTRKRREPKVEAVEEAVAEAVAEPQVADAVEEVTTEETSASEEIISE
jgi:hypothetical protein